MPKAVVIGGARSQIVGSTSRVSWTVDGEELWFDSDDAALEASTEAAASAIVPAATLLGRAVHVAAPIDDEFAIVSTNAAALIANWWGTSAEVSFSQPIRLPAPGGRQGTALFFSGGVDSFYSFLRPTAALDTLVLVHGFDVDLHDHPRFEHLLRVFRGVAQAVGCRSIVVRSNYRHHHLTGSPSWEKTHGGALSAVAHLLGREHCGFQISSSYPFAYDRPNGTHWRLDPLWSSSRVQISHVGAHLWRAEKLRLIADQELVQNNLQVCWEGKAIGGNCARCEKCIRTMILLAGIDRLKQFRVFPGADTLEANIRELRAVHVRYLPVYRSFLDQPLPPGVKQEIARLIARSDTFTARAREAWKTIGAAARYPAASRILEPARGMRQGARTRRK